MFSKKSKPTNNPGEKPVKPAVPSIISADLTVNGNLVSDGEIQIDGTINGDIKTDALLIGEDAKVTGEIHARRVRVHGRVVGQITAKSVTLAATAHVSGDIVHEDLSIDKGAFLEGHCKRIADVETSKKSNLREVTPPVPAAASDKAAPSLAKPSSGNGSNDKADGAKAETRVNA